MGSEVSRLHSRAQSFADRFELGGRRNDIDEAISFDREALELCPPGHSMRARSLTRLSVHLSARYEQFGDMRDIEEGIALDRAALELRPLENPDRRISLNNLAHGLSTRYDQLGAIEDLDEAIALDRDGLALCPPGHPGRFASLSNLAEKLFTRYRKLGGIEDLDGSIALDRDALVLRPLTHPDHSESLNILAFKLHIRYGKLGGMEDLDEGIALDRDALVLRPPGYPGRSTSLNNLAGKLRTRYEKLGRMEDLDEGIALDRDALSLCPPGHPGRSGSLYNLADKLHTRYEKLGGIEDLDEGIALNRDALVLRPPGHPHRSSSLNNLACQLHARYEKLGRMEDLDESVALNRDALVLRSPGHPDRSTSLINLAAKLLTRYEKLGGMEDLDEGISLDRDTLALCPPGHHHHSTSLNNLALKLHTRYQKLGGIEDLDEGIALDRDALTFRPPGHLLRSTSLNNLALKLHTRYKKLGGMEDLDEGIALDREALALHPLGHPFRSHSLTNLARKIHTRYEKLGGMEDLDEGIALNQDALALHPPGHPLRSHSLNDLAVKLHTRYEKLGGMEDLDEAITLDRDALILRPPGHPLRSTSLRNLTGHLHTRFRCLYRSEDREDMFSLYAQLADIPRAVSSDDVSTAKAWVSDAEHFNHPTTVLAYEICLQSLVHHLAVLPSLPRHLDLIKDLASSLAVDAFSACLRNRSPTKAVELLEQGRGVFLNQIARLRSPADDVIASEPEGKPLADEFMEVTSRIRDTLASPGAGQHDHMCRLNVRLEKVVSDIRKLPGHSHFLLSPLFSDLRKAAIEGPVIILNASKYGCDALIIFVDRDPIHVPLSVARDDVQEITLELLRLTKLAKLNDMGKYFAVVMRDLWKGVVSPIVDVLKTVHPLHSRVWWCPTAEFCLLPLRAAGMYKHGEPKFSDLYISSHTTTLTALIHARQDKPSNDLAQGKRFVAVGQANATGESELQSVGKELANIEERVCAHAVFERMEGTESCVDQVVEALGKNQWVHLACHGLPNQERPFESAFGLYDGRLTIERILQCDLKDAEFAYLSACHTTVGDKDGIDEMIHLASAMQFAGFRSVVGTMWAVDDEQTVKVTSRFYEHMVDESGHLDHTRAAYALDKTVKELGRGLSFDQRILYVHFGA